MASNSTPTPTSKQPASSSSSTPRETAPPEIVHVIAEGVLKKQSGLLKSWSPIYARLTQEELIWYSAQGQGKLKGRVSLRQCKAYHAVDPVENVNLQVFVVIIVH